MTVRRSTVAALAAALAVTACSGTASLDPRRWFSRDETPKASPRDEPGVEARLKGVGSAAGGTVRVRQSGDLLILLSVLDGVKPCPYRFVLHERGNCSSPNGFSAGAPWAPPGAKDPATQVLPIMNVNSDGHGEMTVRLRGLRMGDGGMVDRGVLVYEGTAAQPPRPGVPNNVVACGAFVKATTLF